MKIQIIALDGQTNVVELNRLMGSQSSLSLLLDNWFVLKLHKSSTCLIQLKKMCILRAYLLIMDFDGDFLEKEIAPIF